MRVLITPATSFFIYLLTFPHSEGEDSAEAEVGGKKGLSLYIYGLVIKTLIFWTPSLNSYPLSEPHKETKSEQSFCRTQQFALD